MHKQHTHTHTHTLLRTLVVKNRKKRKVEEYENLDVTLVSLVSTV